MSVVALVPARGGSKGIPRKSIAPCAGEPLLAYTARAAQASRRIDRCLLSTDSDEIAAVGRRLGLEIPFLRPAELARDDTPMLAVMKHALDLLEASGEVVRALVLLQPTSPLREAHHIDEAVDLFIRSGAETVVSIVEVPHHFRPESLLCFDQGNVMPYREQAPTITRRQDKPVVYARNGPAVLVVAPATVRRGVLYGEPTLGYLMDVLTSIDVDSAEDLRLAEAVLLHRGTPENR